VPSDEPSDGGVQPQTQVQPRRGRWSIGLRGVLIVVAAVVLLDVLAYVVVPPFDPGDSTASCGWPVCFINGNLELPPPHVVVDLDPATAPPASDMIQFHPSITSTLVTMWIVTLVLLGIAFLVTRRMTLVPGRLQNAIEYVYEMIENFGVGIAGPEAKPYIPLFAGFFLFIIVCNWSGLVPPIGKVEDLRGPTSDLNVTIGLALVSFLFFEYQGFRKLGVRGYLGKFLPLGEFRHGIGSGLIALFVGLIELLLEFVKPVTLSMRLFGNIYGGEVALGVVTALAIAAVPAVMYLLEFILNFAQALIFSSLTLMFTVIAIESHESGEHKPAEFAENPVVTPEPEHAQAA